MTPPTDMIRANSDRNRLVALAEALRNGWKRENKSWLDLAGVALGALRPASEKADASFVIELWPDRTQVRTHAPWGGDPEDLLNRAIEALQAELGALKKCPYHRKKKSAA